MDNDILEWIIIFVIIVLYIYINKYIKIFFMERG